MTRGDFIQGLYNYGIDCNSQTGFYEVSLFAEIITIESAINAGAFDPTSNSMTAEEFMQEIGYEHFLDSIDLYAETLQEMRDRYLNDNTLRKKYE